MIPLIVDMLFIIDDNKKLYSNLSFLWVSNGEVQHGSPRKRREWSKLVVKEIKVNHCNKTIVQDSSVRKCNPLF